VNLLLERCKAKIKDMKLKKKGEILVGEFKIGKDMTSVSLKSDNKKVEINFGPSGVSISNATALVELLKKLEKEVVKVEEQNLFEKKKQEKNK
jgi:hypothetical protein